MVTELLYQFQYGNTPLHLAAREGNISCVECLLSSCGSDAVKIKNMVSGSIQCKICLRHIENFKNAHLTYTYHA